MKKVIALAVLLGMLIPMGLTNIVRSAKAEAKPFYFVNSMQIILVEIGPISADGSSCVFIH